MAKMRGKMRGKTDPYKKSNEINSLAMIDIIEIRAFPQKISSKINGLGRKGGTFAGVRGTGGRWEGEYRVGGRRGAAFLLSPSTVFPLTPLSAIKLLKYMDKIGGFLRGFLRG